MPRVAILGFFSHPWALSLPLQVISCHPSCLHGQVPTISRDLILRHRDPIPRHGASMLAPALPVLWIVLGRWAPCSRAVCRGQGPAPERDIPPAPAAAASSIALLNPGFPARLAGAGALVFRGEGGGSGRILSKG